MTSCSAGRYVFNDPEEPYDVLRKGTHIEDSMKPSNLKNCDATTEPTFLNDTHAKRPCYNAQQGIRRDYFLQNFNEVLTAKPAFSVSNAAGTILETADAPVSNSEVHIYAETFTKRQLHSHSSLPGQSTSKPLDSERTAHLNSIRTNTDRSLQGISQKGEERGLFKGSYPLSNAPPSPSQTQIENRCIAQDDYQGNRPVGDKSSKQLFILEERGQCDSYGLHFNGAAPSLLLCKKRPRSPKIANGTQYTTFSKTAEKKEHYNTENDPVKKELKGLCDPESRVSSGCERKEQRVKILHPELSFSPPCSLDEKEKLEINGDNAHLAGPSILEFANDTQENVKVDKKKEFDVNKCGASKKQVVGGKSTINESNATHFDGLVTNLNVPFSSTLKRKLSPPLVSSPTRRRKCSQELKSRRNGSHPIRRQEDNVNLGGDVDLKNEVTVDVKMDGDDDVCPSVTPTKTRKIGAGKAKKTKSLIPGRLRSMGVVKSFRRLRHDAHCNGKVSVKKRALGVDGKRGTEFDDLVRRGVIDKRLARSEKVSIKPEINRKLANNGGQKGQSNISNDLHSEHLLCKVNNPGRLNVEESSVQMKSTNQSDTQSTVKTVEFTNIERKDQTVYCPRGDVIENRKSASTVHQGNENAPQPLRIGHREKRTKSSENKSISSGFDNNIDLEATHFLPKLKERSEKNEEIKFGPTIFKNRTTQVKHDNSVSSRHARQSSPCTMQRTQGDSDGHGMQHISIAIDYEDNKSKPIGTVGTAGHEIQCQHLATFANGIEKNDSCTCNVLQSKLKAKLVPSREQQNQYPVSVSSDELPVHSVSSKRGFQKTQLSKEVFRTDNATQAIVDSDSRTGISMSTVDAVNPGNSAGKDEDCKKPRRANVSHPHQKLQYFPSQEAQVRQVASNPNCLFQLILPDRCQAVNSRRKTKGLPDVENDSDEENQAGASKKVVSTTRRSNKSLRPGTSVEVPVVDLTQVADDGTETEEKDNSVDVVLEKFEVLQLSSLDVSHISEQLKKERPGVFLEVLSGAEERVVNHAFRVSDDAVLVTMRTAGITLHGRDIKRLDQTRWLNDEIINAYCHLINHRDKRLRTKDGCWRKNAMPRTYMFNTFFYTRLTSVSGGYDYNGVRRWTTRAKVNVLEHDLLLVPVNLGNHHWVLAGIDMFHKRMLYLDSLRGRDCAQVTEYLRRWLLDEVSSKYGAEAAANLDISTWILLTNSYYIWRTGILPSTLESPSTRVGDKLRMSFQSDGGSCGVFTAKVADCLSLGVQIYFKQKDIPLVRRRMALDLLRQSLSP